MRPQLVKQLGLLDLDGVAHGVQGGASDRMSAASGSTTEMKFGKVGKPQIYSEDTESVRFASRLSLNLTVNGASVDVVIQGASAVLLVRGKLVFLSAYLTDDPAARSDTQVRAYLDEAIAAIRALNSELGAGVETKDNSTGRR